MARKQKLEQEIQRLESGVSEVRTRLNKALEEEGVIMNELNCFSNFTGEVRRQRLPMEDLPAFVKTINGVRQLGYDPKTILSKFSDFERLQIVEKELMDRVDSLTTKKTDLERKCAFLETSIETHSITISKYQELEEMGFGLKVQKILWSKIREIGVANQMHPDEAVQKFMKDVELYDDKLGFEVKSHNLKAGDRIESVNQTSMVGAISYLLSVLTTHLDDIQKISQFSPLLRAAKGENVPVSELKSSLIIAIEIMLRVHPLNDMVVKVLNSAKLTLQETLNDII